MKNLMMLFLHMSLCGTAVLAVYCFTTAFLSRQVSAGVRYGLMKLCILCYLLPLPLIWYWLSRQIVYWKGEPADMGVYSTENTVFQSGGRLMMKPLTGSARLLLCLWIAGMFVVLVWRVYRYVKYIKEQWLCSEPLDFCPERLEELRSEIGIRRQVAVRKGNGNTPPFTVGMLRPVIMVNGAAEEPEIELILRHELQHIKSQDLLIRFLALGCLILHFWNPFIYLFWKKSQEAQEYHCDEKVLTELSDSQRTAYGNLLINASVRSTERPEMKIYLSRPGYQFLRKRILRIAHPSKKSKTAAAAVWVIAFLAAGIPASAYEPRTVYMGHGETLTEEEIESSDWVAFEEGEAELFPEDEACFSYTDTYFLSEDGTIVTDLATDSGKSGDSLQAACSHTYVKGTLKSHQKNTADGSCKVYIYSCKKCSKCGKIIDQKLTNTNSYDPCPH